MNELELFEAYMKKEHPFIDVKSEAYAAMRNLWQARVPDGCVVVPKELSVDAIRNLDDRFIEIVLKDDEDYQELYKAMIEAVEK